MARSWHELTKMTDGAKFVVERVRLVDSEIAIEGSFELPAMASLPEEDLVFIAAFVRSHGSIKQMEQWFGVSYPTIKNRLNRIGEKLDFVEIDRADEHDDVLARLERGEISAEEAINLLEKRSKD
jgi:hypothetical protein